MFATPQKPPHGIVIVDECLDVQLWNPWMERVSGIDGYRAMGMNLADLMPGMRTSGLEGQILDAIYTGRTAKLQAHEMSDLAWARDLCVSIKPVDGKTIAAMTGAASSPLVALCAIEFEALDRAAPAVAGRQEKDTASFAATRKRPTALLLEGDPQVRRDMAMMLHAEGFQVCEAEDGVAAVRIVQLSETFDLIFADICDPILGGFDAVMQIRSLPSVKGNIPAIALVADGSFQDRDRLLNAGFSDFSIKSNFENSLPRISRNFVGRGAGTTGGEISHA